MSDTCQLNKAIHFRVSCFKEGFMFRLAASPEVDTHSWHVDTHSTSHVQRLIF